MLNHPVSLYAAFDVYPSAKGAATHIYHFAQALFEKTGRGWLHTLGEADYPVYQQEDDVEITRFVSPVPNYLDRAGQYGAELHEMVRAQQELKLCHFRDPWSGLAILSAKDKKTKTVYEVNGLPSVELPFRYPALGKDTLEKIRALEKICLAESDVIVVPSPVISQHLSKMGVPENKISVIANGAELPGAIVVPGEVPPQYLIYFGALQSWQGVEVLLKAFSLISDVPGVHLVICASAREKMTRPLQRLAEKWGIQERIIWKYQLPRSELQQWISGAMFSVAPLTECTRNLVQGCCPLKILESMACGVPVIASDLPVVRHLITDRENGRLVRADRPAELARLMRLLIEHPDHRHDLGQRARQLIEQQFTWEQQKEKLKIVYERLMRDEGEE